MSRSTISRRAQKGAALAEGAAALALFTPVVVGFVLLILNTCLLGTYQQKLQVAAMQAAQTIDDRRYWLGAARPDFNQSQANQSARQVANAVLRAMGMPNVSSFQVTRTQVPGAGNQGGATVTAVTLAVRGIPLAGGWMLPVPLTATGAAAYTNQQAWRVCQIHFADMNRPGEQPIWRTIQVPCYNFMVGTQPSGTSRTAPGFDYATPRSECSMGFATVGAFLGQNNASVIRTYHGGGATSDTTW